MLYGVPIVGLGYMISYLECGGMLFAKINSWFAYIKAFALTLQEVNIPTCLAVRKMPRGKVDFVRKCFFGYQYPCIDSSHTLHI